MSEIDEMIALINAQMESGVGRLKVRGSELLPDGEVERVYHHGRCDVGSPWAKGTVSNCDAIDVDIDDDLSDH